MTDGKMGDAPNPDLPKLRARENGDRAKCSGCEGTDFETSAGRGEVFVDRGIGMKVRLGSPTGQHLAPPATCTACGVKHDVFADPGIPPPRDHFVTGDRF